MSNLALLLLLLATLVGGYAPLRLLSQRVPLLSQPASMTGAISPGSPVPGGGDETASSSDGVSPVPFDLDFAEAMSKPLPEWYESQKAEREKLLRELQENRERILNEFRAKYEVKDEVKRKELQQNKWSFLDKLNGKRRASTAPGEEGLEGKGEGADDPLSTREKWEMFWKEEEKSTGFYLPGFFEVFPELQLKWPNWAKRKGEAIECERDEDCQFPQACCPHPIVPGDKFCCTGWTQRILVPAYARQVAATDRRTRDEAAEEDARDADERERKGKKSWEPTDD